MSKIKVVHYINQFFAQIGGEEKADYPAEIRVGEVVGPGLALTQNFKDEAEIIATVICGDSYFNENLEKAKADLEEKGLGDHVIVLNESSATVAEAAHALGVEPASIAKTLLDGSFCDSQSNAGNIDSVLQT